MALVIVKCPVVGVPFYREGSWIELEKILGYGADKRKNYVIQGATVYEAELRKTNKVRPRTIKGSPLFTSALDGRNVWVRAPALNEGGLASGGR